MAFCWLADDGPLIVVVGSSLPSLTKKNIKKIKKVKVGPPLIKFSGFACGHVVAQKHFDQTHFIVIIGESFSYNSIVKLPILTHDPFISIPMDPKHSCS